LGFLTLDLREKLTTLVQTGASSKAQDGLENIASIQKVRLLLNKS